MFNVVLTLLVPAPFQEYARGMPAYFTVELHAFKKIAVLTLLL